MTVNDLIKILQTLPPDLTVVNEGYETGYEPIKSVTIIKVDENKSHEWWDGNGKAGSFNHPAPECDNSNMIC